jgi:tetratricopeptide (TPR) repeat protein
MELMSGHEASKHVTQSTFWQYTPVPGLVCPADAVNAKHKAITRLAQDSFSFLISSSIQSEILARRIISLAEVANVLRQTSELELLGRCLELTKYRHIGAYYQGIAKLRSSRNLEQAERLFEQAQENVPTSIRARALLSLGAIEGYRGNIQAEARYYARAISTGEADYFTRIEAVRAIALLYAIEGNHRRAIDNLESLYPIARKFAPVNARLYLDVLNSLTVEYLAVRDTEAASRAFEPVRNSLLIGLIQEFRETAQEVAEAKRTTRIVVVPARSFKQKPKPKVIIRFQYVESSARHRSFKPTIGRAPVFRSIIERVATVAPIHAPPTLLM